MAVLTGLKNFLLFIEENWTMIAAIITAAYVVGKKLYTLILSLIQNNGTTEEQLESIKSTIKEIILKYTSDAETEYAGLTSVGTIKRAQVIKQLYEDFPALASVIDQESLIEFIDEQIDASLEILREIIKTNSSSEEDT